MDTELCILKATLIYLANSVLSRLVRFSKSVLIFLFCIASATTELLYLLVQVTAFILPFANVYFLCLVLPPPM